MRYVFGCATLLPPAPSSKKKRELTNEGDRVEGGRRGKRGMGGKYTEEHGRTNGGAVTNCKLIGRIYIS